MDRKRKQWAILNATDMFYISRCSLFGKPFIFVSTIKVVVFARNSPRFCTIKLVQYESFNTRKIFHAIIVFRIIPLLDCRHSLSLTMKYIYMGKKKEKKVHENCIQNMTFDLLWHREQKLRILKFYSILNSLRSSILQYSANEQSIKTDI